MANYTTSPNMNLTIPTVSTDPGPDWASNLNTSLSAIDVHDHSSGKGVPVTPSGININSDLTLAANNLISARTVRLFTNTAQPVLATDLGCLYRFGVDLYFNDGSGNQIRITQSGSVSGSSGTITGLPSGTASAAYSNVSGSFIFQQATSTGANLDVASVAIRYPGSYPTPSGNYIQLQAPSSLATGYALTLPATLPAASGALLTVSTAGVVSHTNADGATITIAAGVIKVPAAGIGTAQIADGAVTAAKITFTAPTVQKFLTGSGTYTRPATAKYIKVKMVGPGGGGSGSGTGGTGGAGVAGGNTTFGVAGLACTGGGGGSGGSGVGGAGGTATVGSSGAYGTVLTGARGQGGSRPGSSVASGLSGGEGASTPLGGGGSGGNGIVSTAGGNPPVNSGSGGGGGGGNQAAIDTYSGSGGGAGGYLDVIIPAPSASYAYSIDVGGTGGTAGTAGTAGGDGSIGYIEVTEYYY